MNKLEITADKREELKAELATLVAKRPQIAEDLAYARSFGDLSENAEYDAAREAQKVLESRVQEIEHILEHATIIKSKKSDKVVLGSKITLRDDKKEVAYQIVSPVEANPLQSKLSSESPLGLVLMGHKVGDEVEFNAPKGKITYIITEIA
ncbi:MAG: transcription elongation factor GreA [Candidatus Nomurabacteria bacterium]|jgi:transcription elongation factor GreA|nr:transcription elongation factor GreA [Candidatus Nomurabacteria bacterium]